MTVKTDQVLLGTVCIYIKYKLFPEPFFKDHHF